MANYSGELGSLRRVIAVLRDVEKQPALSSLMNELSVMQLQVLLAVAQHSGITTNELARDADVAQPSVSRNAAVFGKTHRLAGKPGLDYIEDFENPRKTRGKIYQLTPRGRDVMDKVVSAFIRQPTTPGFIEREHWRQLASLSRAFGVLRLSAPNRGSNNKGEITLKQAQILLTVALNPGVTSSGLVETLGVDDSVISRGTKALNYWAELKLARRGANYLESIRDPRHENNKVHFLTAHGAATVGKAIGFVTGKVADFNPPTAKDWTREIFKGARE